MPSLFNEIDSGLKDIFYSQSDIERWNFYRVVAMDETSLITNKAIYTDFKNHPSEDELENSTENHSHTFFEEDQLHSVTLHDTLNDICLGVTIDSRAQENESQV